MSYKAFINKPNLFQYKDSLSFKLKNSFNIKKNDLLVVGYHEHDKEEIKLEQYMGYCVKMRKNGANTKLVMDCKLQKTKLRLNFFFFNPFLFDFKKFS